MLVFGSEITTSYFDNTTHDILESEQRRFHINIAEQLWKRMLPCNIDTVTGLSSGHIISQDI